MMRRLLGVLVVTALGLTMVAERTAASPDTTSVIHFTGRAGSTVLTDCAPGSAPGTQCRAVSVFAFEQRVNEDGVRFGGAGFEVTLFDVTITTEPPFFDAVEVGSGFTDQATVAIAKGLSRGTAAASDVALQSCDFPDPTGPPVCTDAGSVSVTVQWQGSGPTSKFRFHDMFSDPFAFDNSRTGGSTRAADASGTLDGAPVEDTALFPSTLQSDTFGSVFRFASLATSVTTAVAAATAASIEHTLESSAFGVLSDCPPAPEIGTTCTGVIVTALALSGKAGRQPVDQQSVFADFFDLSFTPDGLVAVFVASGFDDTAVVNIDPALASASATADLVVCDEFGCATSPVALSAAWTGLGDVQAFRFHSQVSVPGFKSNSVGSGQARAAGTTATIDGVPYTDFFGSGGTIETVSIKATSK